MLESRICRQVCLAAKWDEGLLEEEHAEAGILIRRIRLRTHALPRRMPWQFIKAFEWRRSVARYARSITPGLIIAHSLPSLAVGVACRRSCRAPLIYDAHELETERNGAGRGQRWVSRQLERRWLTKCDGAIVVNDSIAEWYRDTYRIPRPTVVRNIPDWTEVPADSRGADHWRQRFSIPPDHLIFIYQGGLFSGRRIRQFLRVFAGVGPDRHVVFMGYGELEAAIRAAAARHRNIHLAPSVAPGEVMRHSAAADVGLVGGENVCLSYFYGLPNKLFEYLFAGLPCLIPAYPEMARIGRETGACWEVGESDGDWTGAVQGMTRERIEAGRRAARRARDLYSWAKERERFIDACASVLERRPVQSS